MLFKQNIKKKNKYDDSWQKGAKLDKKQLLQLHSAGASSLDFSFQTIARCFQMIESCLMPLIIPYDNEVEQLIDNLRYAERIELLRSVGIRDPRSRYREYPHEFSGGMQQRILIAMAVALRPSLIVADEPTTALDATVQVRILELLRRLQKETGASILLITHDLRVVASLFQKKGPM